MKMPKDVTFLFQCTKHRTVLTMGSDAQHKPTFKHPNAEATAVWCIDWSNVRCYGASTDESPRIGTECQDSWEWYA
jgi:hypothetical protein